MLLTPVIPGVRISQEAEHQEWGWCTISAEALPWTQARSPALGNQEPEHDHQGHKQEEA